MMITTNPNGFTANFGTKEIDVCQGASGEVFFVRTEHIAADGEAITVCLTATEFDTFVSYCKGLTLR